MMGMENAMERTQALATSHFARRPAPVKPSRHKQQRHTKVEISISCPLSEYTEYKQYNDQDTSETITVIFVSNQN